jgi:hypothetical protein
MNRAGRVKKLEHTLSRHCPTCGEELRCPHCADTGSADTGSGYDLSRLTVEELRQLRGLLKKSVQEGIGQ